MKPLYEDEKSTIMKTRDGGYKKILKNRTAKFCAICHASSLQDINH